MYQQFSHGDDAAASRLPLRGSPEFSSTRRTAAQRGVERRQRAGSSEAAGYFDRRPVRRRSRPVSDHDQGCSVATMHDEPVDRPQLVTRRIEHVQIGWVLGIEAEHRRGRRKAYRDCGAACQVESSQPQCIRWFSKAVDALPNTFDELGFQYRLEVVSRYGIKNLAAGCDSALRFEELLKRDIHTHHRGMDRIAAGNAAVQLWMNIALCTDAHPRRCAKCW